MMKTSRRRAAALTLLSLLALGATACDDPRDAPWPALCAPEPNAWTEDNLGIFEVRTGAHLDVELRLYQTDREGSVSCADDEMMRWDAVRSSAPNILRVSELDGQVVRLEGVSDGIATLDFFDGKKIVFTREIRVVTTTRITMKAVGFFRFSSIVSRAEFNVARESDVWMDYMLMGTSGVHKVFGAEPADAWTVSPPEAATLTVYDEGPDSYQRRLLHVKVLAQPGESFTIKHQLGGPLTMTVLADEALGAIQLREVARPLDAPEPLSTYDDEDRQRDKAWALKEGLRPLLYDMDGEPVLGEIPSTWEITSGQDRFSVAVDTPRQYNTFSPPPQRVMYTDQGDGELTVTARGLQAVVPLRVNPPR